jgi:hypothetical protein
MQWDAKPFPDGARRCRRDVAGRRRQAAFGVGNTTRVFDATGDGAEKQSIR